MTATQNNNAGLTGSSEAKTSHTPGPWYFESEILGVTGTQHFVAEFYSESNRLGNYRGAICRIQDAHHIRDGIAAPEAEANARLIASAPDLLEALKTILAKDSQYFPALNTTHYGNFADIARAAIAKAEGNTI